MKEVQLPNVPGVTYSTNKFSGKYYFTFTHTRSGMKILDIPWYVKGIRPMVAAASEILKECDWDIEWPETPDIKAMAHYFNCRTKLLDASKILSV